MPTSNLKIIANLVLLLLWGNPTFGQVDLNPPASTNAQLSKPRSVLESTRPDTIASAGDETRKSVDAGTEFDKLITGLLLENIPHNYLEDKDWGKQDKRWDGLDISRDKFRIKTKRKWKMVNHGSWKKYSVQLLNPQEEFTVQLKNLHQTANGNSGFDVHFTAHLKLDARRSKWIKGVQLYSLSGEGHAKVRLQISFEMESRLDLKKLPPDLILTPSAKTASLHIDEFRLDRISKIGGEITQQLGKQARELLEKKIKEKEHKLVDKINRGIEKNKSKLRLSIDDAIKSKWTQQAEEVLPDVIRNAIEEAKQHSSTINATKK